MPTPPPSPPPPFAFEVSTTVSIDPLQLAAAPISIESTFGQAALLWASAAAAPPPGAPPQSLMASVRITSRLLISLYVGSSIDVSNPLNLNALADATMAVACQSAYSCVASLTQSSGSPPSARRMQSPATESITYEVVRTRPPRIYADPSNEMLRQSLQVGDTLAAQAHDVSLGPMRLRALDADVVVSHLAGVASSPDAEATVVAALADPTQLHTVLQSSIALDPAAIELSVPVIIRSKPSPPPSPSYVPVQPPSLDARSPPTPDAPAATPPDGTRNIVDIFKSAFQKVVDLLTLPGAIAALAGGAFLLLCFCVCCIWCRCRARARRRRKQQQQNFVAIDGASAREQAPASKSEPSPSERTKPRGSRQEPAGKASRPSRADWNNLFTEASRPRGEERDGSIIVPRQRQDSRRFSQVALDFLKDFTRRASGIRSSDGAQPPPPAAQPAPPPAEMISSSADASNWEAVQTDEGDTYFHNVMTGETTWEPPAEMQQQAAFPNAFV